MFYLLSVADYWKLRAASALKLNANVNDQEGQGLVEYALILVLVAVVVIAILSFLGPQIGCIFGDVKLALENGNANHIGGCDPTGGPPSP